MSWFGAAYIQTSANTLMSPVDQEEESEPHIELLTLAVAGGNSRLCELFPKYKAERGLPQRNNSEWQVFIMLSCMCNHYYKTA